MRQRRSAIWVCGLLLLVGALRAAAASEEAAAKRVAQNAREEAKRTGFKLEYGELLPVLTPEEQSRAAVITNAGFALRPLRLTQSLKWMEPMARGAARCGWQSEGKWNEVAGELETIAAPLDAAAEILQADRPLRFVVGPSLLLPHLAGLKSLANAFTARMALALRDGNTAEAWTNLLAVTALAIRYDPEPAEVSHLVRAGLVQQAFVATWEALQTNVWTDTQLGDLSGQWARVDVFRGVPDTAMLQAAQLLTYTAAVRGEYLTNHVVTPELSRLGRSSLTEPGRAWNEFRDLVHYAASQKDYARKGSYLDEVLIIRFYQKRAGELRRAIGQTNWLAMRPLPGVTNHNFLSLTTNTPSHLQSLVNSREIMMATSLYASGGGANTALGRLVETEARRRVLLTALAVQREHLRQGQPPKSLADVPGAVRDFITGDPLRYRVETNGSVVLYSPGVDTEDNGGEMLPTKIGEIRSAAKADLVWPRMATATDSMRLGRDRGSAPDIDPVSGNFRPAVQSTPEPDDNDPDDPP